LRRLLMQLWFSLLPEPTGLKKPLSSVAFEVLLALFVKLSTMDFHAHLFFIIHKNEPQYLNVVHIIP